jgi:[glutamine synthetase] adenylyltransferase / [glutamine synthetase]-adenylyl-L-tyrosine phosphorylase
VILALGKHGAFELNYSSDVDLIILYDPDDGATGRRDRAASFFVRLSKRLVGLLQDPTEDGFAFRVDLRLRPDPRATQIAIAVEAAANHYEYMGQNWERAAMIKARPIAGDLALGQEFLDRLKPYVWRKYLDFAAIADIQSLKRQIYQVKGHGKPSPCTATTSSWAAAASARSSSSSRPSS